MSGAWGGVPLASQPQEDRIKPKAEGKPLDRRALEQALILAGQRGNANDHAVRRGEFEELVASSGNQSFDVEIQDIRGILDDPATLFRNAGLSAPEIVDTLPTSITDNFTGRVVFLTSDSRIYRFTSQGAWSRSVDAADVTGQMTNAQLADLAAAKLTGQITGTQITDNAITAAKINAGAVTAGKVAANAITADKIAANAITAAKISAGAITATKMAANSITANNIVANTITGGLLATSGIITQSAQIGAAIIGEVQIANNAVTADKILANSVTADKINVNSLSALSATIGTLQSAASGERIVIETDKISVYDASGSLRVRIGNLA